MFQIFKIVKFLNLKKYSEIRGATSISDAFIVLHSHGIYMLKDQTPRKSPNPQRAALIKRYDYLSPRQNKKITGAPNCLISLSAFVVKDCRLKAPLVFSIGLLIVISQLGSNSPLFFLHGRRNNPDEDVLQNQLPTANSC